MLRHAFRAMGTEVEFLLDAEDPSLLREGEAEFRRLEGIFSRFRPDSELSRLNEAGERHVGPELFEVIELAVEAREASCGRFDPTVHAAVVAAGYDRSFELIDDDVPASATAAARTGGAVAFDQAAGQVAIEPGYRLDLGGIAKGWAADRVRRRPRAGWPGAGERRRRHRRLGPRVADRAWRLGAGRSRSASRTAGSRPAAAIAAPGCGTVKRDTT